MDFIFPALGEELARGYKPDADIGKKESHEEYFFGLHTYYKKFLGTDEGCAPYHYREYGHDVIEGCVVCADCFHAIN